MDGLMGGRMNVLESKTKSRITNMDRSNKRGESPVWKD